MNNLMVFETHTIIDNTEDVDVLKKQIAEMKSTMKEMKQLIDALMEATTKNHMLEMHRLKLKKDYWKP